MILAAIPAYNEEIAIAGVILRTKQYVDRVLVVDDGSTDATASVAQMAGAEVIRHEINRGKGAALETVFQQAKQLGADIVVCLDADGQHNPDEIPRLLDGIKNENADMVIGSRFLDAGHSVPFYRRIGQEVLNSLTNSISNTKVSDSQSGFRAFSKKAIGLLSCNEMGIGIESQLHHSADVLHLKIIEVPISCRYDVKNSSKLNPFNHGFHVINAILKIVEERRPLLFFGVPGLILVSIGLFLGVQVVSIYTTTYTFAIGTALVVILFLMVGTISIFNGIMLHSISKILQK